MADEDEDESELEESELEESESELDELSLFFAFLPIVESCRRQKKNELIRGDAGGDGVGLACDNAASRRCRPARSIRLSPSAECSGGTRLRM